MEYDRKGESSRFGYIKDSMANAVATSVLMISSESWNLKRVGCPQAKSVTV